MVAFACLLAWPVQAGTARPLTVSAAVSLTDVMQAVGHAYETAGHGRLTFNFAASNVLARQIANGAPVDVFLSADEAQMDVVRRHGLVARDGVVPLCGNRLAVIVRSELAGVVTSAGALAAPSVRRVAIGNPEAVPAGVYARQHLERAGLWTAIEPKLLLSGSVRAALAAIASGAADAGIVYVTDARRSRGIHVASVIDGPEAPRIVYVAAVLSSGRRAGEAAGFLRFLRADAAQRIFTEHGFTPLSAEHR